MFLNTCVPKFNVTYKSLITNAVLFLSQTSKVSTVVEILFKKTVKTLTIGWKSILFAIYDRHKSLGN